MHVSSHLFFRRFLLFSFPFLSFHFYFLFVLIAFYERLNSPKQSITLLVCLHPLPLHIYVYVCVRLCACLCVDFAHLAIHQMIDDLDGNTHTHTHITNLFPNKQKEFNQIMDINAKQ